MKIILFILFSLNLMAQPEDPRKDKNHPCVPDFPLFCKNEIPSDANYWNCLREKMNILSPRCYAFMKDYYIQKNPCGKEILSFCPGRRQNASNWYKCVLERRSEVSNKCGKLLDELQDRYSKRDEAIKVCHQEKLKHCKSIGPGRCLYKIRLLPEAELSPECKRKLHPNK